MHPDHQPINSARSAQAGQVPATAAPSPLEDIERRIRATTERLLTSDAHLNDTATRVMGPENEKESVRGPGPALGADGAPCQLNVINAALFELAQAADRVQRQVDRLSSGL